MYNKIRFKCPNCGWGADVLGDGILAPHENDMGQQCHMSNQFPFDRLSNQAGLYQRGLNHLDHFLDIVGDRWVRIWLDGECVMYQCEDYFGMSVPIYDIIQAAQGDRAAQELIYYRRQELLGHLQRAEGSG